MKTIFILFLFSTLIFGDNPRVYRALGDDIYDNLKAIQSLKDTQGYCTDKSKINSYIKDVKKAKEEGFKIQAGDKSIDNKIYLTKLRSLSKQNNEFMRRAKASFKEAISKNNSDLFNKIVNSGLIDVDKNKDEILNYYLAHKDEVENSMVIQSLFEINKQINRKKAVRQQTKKQIQDAKIKRLRASQKAKQRVIEKTLEEELKKKKEEIRRNQKIELNN